MISDCEFHNIVMRLTCSNICILQENIYTRNWSHTSWQLNNCGIMASLGQGSYQVKLRSKRMRESRNNWLLLIVSISIVIGWIRIEIFHNASLGNILQNWADDSCSYWKAVSTISVSNNAVCPPPHFLQNLDYGWS